MKQCILVLLLSIGAAAQTSNLTATITDPDAQTWNNGTFTITFVPTPGVPGPYTWNGGQPFTQQFRGSMSNTGIITQALPSSNFIVPSGSQWQFTLCSNSSAPCQNVTLAVTGAAPNLSSALSAPLIAPRFSAGQYSFGYLDAEVTGPNGTALLPGVTYWNVTNLVTRQWNGSAWQNLSGGGGGGTPGAPPGSLQFNNAGSFAGTTDANNTTPSSYTPATATTTIPNLDNIRYVTPSYAWSQSPSGSLTGGTPATVTLTPCPRGVSGTDANLYFYIAGTGTPEFVLSSATGSCTSANATGTVTFTPVNSHSAGFTIQSGSAGIYEAYRDASAGGGPNNRLVLQPAGANANAYQVQAPIIIAANHTQIEGPGALVKCFTRSTCFQIGDHTNSNDFVDIRFKGFRVASGTNVPGVAVSNTSRTGCPGAGTCAISITTGSAHPFVVGDWVDIQMTNSQTYWGIWQVATVPDNLHFTALYSTQANPVAPSSNIASAASIGQVALENAAFEINAGSSVVEDVSFESGSTGPGTAGRFHNGIIDLNDQELHINRPQLASGSAFRCDASYCGQVIYGPGPFSQNAGIINIMGGQLSMQCAGNGITNYDGNTLSVTNVVIQGFNQWAILNSASRGGFGPATLANVYNEVGSCGNPQYSGGLPQAEAGFLNGVATFPSTMRGGEFPIGSTAGIMNCVGSGGSNALNYYIVVTDSVLGSSYPLFAGATPANCSGNVTVQWPRVQGTNTITYDVLRAAATNGTSPYVGGCAGGSVTACGSVALAQAQCLAQVCSFTDNSGANTSNYTISAPTYYPVLYFWPGGGVNTTAGDTQNIANVARTVLDNTAFVTTPSPLTSEAGWQLPTFFAHECSTITPGTFVSCLAENSSGNSSLGATILQAGEAVGGTASNLKGRLNFNWFSVPLGHAITLVDVNPSKTVATNTNRPPNDANDTYIGFDTPGGAGVNNVQLAVGAPISISHYIGNSGDGSSWKERLTSSAKTYSVQIVSTVSTGTPPLSVASTTVVPNLNVGQLLGGTWASPGTIGSTTPNTIAGTTGTFSGLVTASSFLATNGGWIAGTIAAVGDVLCPSASNTASDCSHSPPNNSVIGVANTTSGTVYPQTSGFATLNYDATVSPVAGWFACVSAITDGKVLVQATPCPVAQKQVGIVAVGGINVTSGSVWTNPFGGAVAPSPGTIVYTTPSAATTSSIAATTMATAGGSGNTYRFSFYLDQTALGVGCGSSTTIAVNVTWTDPNSGSPQSTSFPVNFSIGGNGTVGLGSPGQSNTFRSKASTVIQYFTTYTAGSGCGPSPAYQAFPILELLN